MLRTAATIGGYSRIDPHQTRRLPIVLKIRIKSELTELDDQLFHKRDPV